MNWGRMGIKGFETLRNLGRATPGAVGPSGPYTASMLRAERAAEEASRLRKPSGEDWLSGFGRKTPGWMPAVGGPVSKQVTAETQKAALEIVNRARTKAWRAGGSKMITSGGQQVRKTVAHRPLTSLDEITDPAEKKLADRAAATFRKTRGGRLETDLNRARGGQAADMLGMAPMAAGGTLSMLGSTHIGQAVTGGGDQARLMRAQAAMQGGQQRQIMKMQRLQKSRQKNAMRLAEEAPDLFSQLAAGRELPIGAEVIGGQPRTDLISMMADRMGQGGFQDPFEALLS